MQIRVSGSNIEVGQSLTQYVEEHLVKEVVKYFDKAIKAEVHFSKENPHLFKVLIFINEGVSGGIVVKSTAEAGDAYSCFSEALEKATKQLRRYKRRIKNYRHKGGGIKNADPNYEFEATKYVIPQTPTDELDAEGVEINFEEKPSIIEEKTTNIETLSINEAVMKMDLSDLPALVFVNKDNGGISVIYHRKDGNISLIDTKTKK